MLIFAEAWATDNVGLSRNRRFGIQKPAARLLVGTRLSRIFLSCRVYPRAGGAILRK
jgi:hypothetical protein